MVEIRAGLWIGSIRDCVMSDYRRWVVHACKSPCHQRALGYQGSLGQDHDHYLSYRRGNELYLNMIDPREPLFRSRMFLDFLDFADQAWSLGKELLIHCNKAESRAPSLALLFMAKRLSELNDSSYQLARSDFEDLYPDYRPGQGLERYLTDNWHQL